MHGSVRGQPMASGEICDAVNRQGLYVRRDGQPVGTSQVAARVRNYADMFEIQTNGWVWLADPRETGEQE